MNVIRVYGGLGNQLFQYALGKTISCHGGVVGFDLAWYARKEKRFPRPMCLRVFNTEFTIAARTNKHPTLREDPEKIYPIHVLDKVNYIGYWQSPYYHKGIYSILQNEFWVKEEFYTKEYREYKEKILNTNSVALHVRRGDFLMHPSHYVVPLDYYQKALSLVKNLKTNPHIFVFSDDLPWCKKAFEGENVTFVETRDYLEFDLMRLCKTKIIGNSTFSWWPAYLDETGLVICPKKWWVKEQADELTRRKSMLLDRWIKL